MRTNWLSPAETDAWRSYIETNADLTAAIERDLAEDDLTLGDYQVLVFLSEIDGRTMRMCDLADRLRLSPSGLTRRLDGLVEAGYVERSSSTDDRRVMLAGLTDAGFEKLRDTAPNHLDSVRRRIFDHLDADQIVAMASIFAAIGKGLAA